MVLDATTIVSCVVLELSLFLNGARPARPQARPRARLERARRVEEVVGASGEGGGDV